MSRHLKLIPLLALLSLARLPAQETVVVTPTVLNGLPADTSLVIRFSSGRDFYQKLQASPLSSLRSHPDYKPLIDMALAEIEKGAAEGEKELGFNPLELLDTLDGEVTFSLGSIQKIVEAIMREIGAGGSGEDAVKPGDIPLLITANARSKAPAMRKKLARIFSKIEEEENVKSSVRDFHGARITTFKAPENSNDDLEAFYFGELGSTFFFGINQSYFESTLANMTGQQGKTLSKSVDFIESQAQLGDLDPDFLVFVNLQSMLGSIKQNLQANPLFQIIYGMVESKILGSGLKNMAASMDLQGDGIHSVSFVNTGGQREGLLALFDGPGFSAAEAAREAPPSVDTFSTTNFDFGRFYQLVREVANMAMSMAQNNPGIDVEQLIEGQFQIKPRELFSGMGPRVSWFARSAGDGPSTNDPLGLGDFGLAIALKDQKAVDAFLQKLPAVLSQNLFLSGMKTEKHGDSTVYHFSSEGPVASIAGNKLYVTLKPSFLKDLINRSSKPSASSLANDPAFQKATTGFPEKLSTVSFTRKEYLKKSLEPLQMLAREQGEEIPDLGAILDLFDGSAGYAVWNEKGLLSRGKIPFRKTSK